MDAESLVLCLYPCNFILRDINLLQFGSIITTRLIMIIAAQAVTADGNYFTAHPCAQLEWDNKGDVQKTLHYYPECESYFNGSNPNQHGIIHADFKGRYEEVGAALDVSFGMATWLALALHAIGVEIYVRTAFISSFTH